MDFLKISLLILAAVIIVTCLPTFNKNISAAISIAVCILVVTYLISIITPVIEQIRYIFDTQSADFSIVFKTMGIAMVTQFVSDIAADNGNKALGNQMIFAGKLAIVVLALPVFIQIIEIMEQLTG